MSPLIHKRLPGEFVMEVLEAFNEHRMTEQQACLLLGLQRSQFYAVRQRWLQATLRGQPFRLWNRLESAFHRWLDEIQAWLHEQLRDHPL